MVHISRRRNCFLWKAVVLDECKVVEYSEAVTFATGETVILTSVLETSYLNRHTRPVMPQAVLVIVMQAVLVIVIKAVLV